MISVSVFTKADSLYTDCSSGRNYTPNGQFQNNLKLLLNDLFSNTTRNDTSLGEVMPTPPFAGTVSGKRALPLRKLH
ncbi:hypothetical protein PanWU01x14_292560 [Parasponia andersonii]|uniref:Uncharacterized protein n=1 Tax=Parasponia andersonii TaxID=3476 RepID=A0A2P5AWY7_PARAD|nr:hypothetical protein PanWU01x14_292560 [Parasponia andersonii]